MKYSSAPYAIQILTGSLLLVTAGCETTDKILGGAESVLRSGTTRSVIDIATSKDPAEMARRRAKTTAVILKRSSATCGRFNEISRN
ncbi:MAG: hypothetical protein U0231_17160 [Nitrospiraceae bacterium]